MLHSSSSSSSSRMSSMKWKPPAWAQGRPTSHPAHALQSTCSRPGPAHALKKPLLIGLLVLLALVLASLLLIGSPNSPRVWGHQSLSPSSRSFSAASGTSFRSLDEVVSLLTPVERLGIDIALLGWMKTYADLSATEGLQVDFPKLLASATVSRAAATRRTDMAFLTYSTDEDLKRNGVPVLMNILYAMAQGYDFILEQDTGFQVPFNATLYLKLKCIQKHLPRYQALVYLDADALILDDPRQGLFRRLLFEDQGLKGADFMIADHSDVINAGVMLFRNTPFTHELLQRWWRKIEQHREFKWWDQSALYLVMIDDLARLVPSGPAGVCPPKEECEAKEVLMGSLNYCLGRQLLCRGMPYGSPRSIGPIRILPQSVREYRINQLYMDDHSAHPTWHKDNWYREGDPVVHTKQHSAVLNDTLFMLRFETLLAVSFSRWPTVEDTAL